MRNVTFSVIIPLFNKAAHIQRAITSVLAQTYMDYELIVVNDGSQDGGELIVAENTDYRIRLVSQENQGVSVARNRGIAESKGEYIAFLDADDEWMPHFLNCIRELIVKYPQAGLFSTGYLNRISRKVDSNQVPEVFRKSNDQLVPDYFATLLEINCSLNNSSCSCVSRSALDQVGGFPIGRVQYEDHDLWYRLALLFPVAYHPEACSIIYKDADNRSSYSWDACKVAVQFGKLVQNLQPLLADPAGDEAKQKSCARWLASRESFFFRAMIKTGQIQAALNYCAVYPFQGINRLLRVPPIAYAAYYARRLVR